MRISLARPGAALVWTFGLITAMGLSACDDEAEPDEVPEVGRLEVEPGEIELEEVFPLTPADTGQVVVATGTVVGRPLPNGFFMRTEGAQVLFVVSPAATPVNPGDTVRVAGPLHLATAAVFEGWERDALEGEIQAEWKVQPLYFVEAAAVEKRMGGAARGAPAVTPGAPPRGAAGGATGAATGSTTGARPR